MLNVTEPERSQLLETIQKSPGHNVDCPKCDRRTGHCSFERKSKRVVITCRRCLTVSVIKNVRFCNSRI